MTDFVGDDVGLREVAGARKRGREIAEEREIEYSFSSLGQ
jgi:hypothetical protein